jgi:ABC-type bacteriocin/lantibiotic exporter with double-glycine peptidase domain
LLDAITVAVSALIGLLVLGIYNPLLLMLNLIIIGVMIVTIYFLGRGAIRTSIQESRAKYMVAGRLEEIARAPVSYKLDGGAEIAWDRTESLTRRYITARRHHFRILVRQLIFLLGFEALATASLLGLGGFLVINEQLSLGQLVAAELIVATVVSSFAKMFKHIEAFYDLMAATDKVGHLIDLPLERNHGEDVDETTSAGAAVTAHGLHYEYHHGHDVLHGIDLKLQPGERVAIIGTSGSGKSTLLDILGSLRFPSHGYVELDGINYRDLSLESIRRNVAVVKGLEILDETILENVRMARAGITLSDVRHALEDVGLLEEISELPDGLHTRLSTCGSPLSQGQAARIMLARAIVARPKLLLVDEWLDGADVAAKQRILKTLFNRSAPWTLLIVTHNQEISEKCDRAIAMDFGKAISTVAMSNGHSPRIEDWLKETRSCRFE